MLKAVYLLNIQVAFQEPSGVRNPKFHHYALEKNAKYAPLSRNE